jgi:methyl-accepting chemotaxis protein
MERRRSWTVGRQLAVAISVPLFFLVLIGVYAYQSTQQLLEATTAVAHTREVLTNLSNVLSSFQDIESGERGFVITGREEYLEPYDTGKIAIEREYREGRRLTADNMNQQARFDDLRRLLDEELAQLDATIKLRRRDGAEAAARAVDSGRGKRTMDAVRSVIAAMTDEEEKLLVARTSAINDAVRTFARTLVGACLLAFLTVGAVGATIVRGLNIRIGSAAERIRDAARDLEVAANLQAKGAEEQVAASAQVSTTIRDLAVTARQIAESAHRVTDVAASTNDATLEGDQTVLLTREAVESSRKQVDAIVAHMLGLGRKSQEIGGILDIINDLSEQTNILAINATVEAIGAGEAGRRFRVVADEIRKLADRVTASTRSIRRLVEEVRGAANTTAAATEHGAKAVEATTQRFGEVGTSFERIRAFVGNTASAAREIEMSTRQQTTAMEQVAQAVVSVSDTARDVETGAAHALRTASELSGLSEQLLRLIRDDGPRRALAA